MVLMQLNYRKRWGMGVRVVIMLLVQLIGKKGKNIVKAAEGGGAPW